MNIYLNSYILLIIFASCLDRKSKIELSCYSFSGDIDSLESLDDNIKIFYLIPDSFLHIYNKEYSQLINQDIISKSYVKSHDMSNEVWLTLKRPSRYFKKPTLQNCEINPRQLKIRYIIDTVPSMIHHYSNEYCITYFILNIPDLDTQNLNDSTNYGLCFYYSNSHNIHFSIELRGQNLSTKMFEDYFHCVAKSVRITNEPKSISPY